MHGEGEVWRPGTSPCCPQGDRAGQRTRRPAAPGRHAPWDSHPRPRRGCWCEEGESQPVFRIKCGFIMTQSDYTHGGREGPDTPHTEGKEAQTSWYKPTARPRESFSFQVCFGYNRPQSLQLLKNKQTQAHAQNPTRQLYTTEAHTPSRTTKARPQPPQEGPPPAPGEGKPAPRSTRASRRLRFF